MADSLLLSGSPEFSQIRLRPLNLATKDHYTRTARRGKAHLQAESGSIAGLLFENDLALHVADAEATTDLDGNVRSALEHAIQRSYPPFLLGVECIAVRVAGRASGIGTVPDEEPALALAPELIAGDDTEALDLVDGLEDVGGRLGLRRRRLLVLGRQHSGGDGQSDGNNNEPE